MSNESDLQRIKLSAERLELLNKLLRQKGLLPHKNSISRYKRPSSTEIPLSFAQQRLWFLHQLEPQNTAYNMPAAFRISGLLDKIALEHSFNEIIQRHEILRTIFANTAEQPVQCILPEYSLAIPFSDLSAYSDVEQNAILTRLITAVATTPFDLVTGPLLRIQLIQLQEQEHFLLITLHHIIADGWSVDILIRELSIHYTTTLQRQPPSLPQLKLQYADYTLWQREKPQLDILTQQLEYWKQRLADATPVPGFPTDRQPEEIATEGDFYRFTLSAELVQGLKAVSQQEGVTLFMMLIATWFTLLYRYTGQQDMMLGTPVAGRNHPDLEDLIGFFVNTVVLRVSVSAQLRFCDFLQQVRQVALDAFTHQDVPFEQVVAAVRPERSKTNNPLFQMMFSLHAQSLSQVKLADLKFTVLDIHNSQAQFDMSLDFFEESDTVAGIVEYKKALFQTETIARLVEHLQNLLQSIVANPTCYLTDLPYLSEREQQNLSSWNITEAPFSHTSCIHHLIELQNQRTPDAIALVSEEGYLTYRELNRRAEELATYLQTLEVGPEVRVGLCIERSLDQIVSLLGILKAGGVFVALDPMYPQDRLTYITQRSQAQVIITLRKYRELFFDQQNAPKLVCLDMDRDHIKACQDRELARTVVPGNLAYLIYTSGSTGLPKGTMITHSSLVNYIEHASHAFGIQQDEHVLQFASLTFDAALEEIFSCLISGATLILRTDAVLDTIQTFLKFCQKYQMNVIDIPTSYWHLVATELASPDIELPLSLRLVIIGAEHALPERLSTWQHAVGDRVRILNTYGPTEATIVATTYDITHFTRRNAKIPIGRAIPNAQVYILDQHLHQVPIGVFGELYIGGAGLARGYIYQPDLTAEYFIPNPFSAEVGSRLYRTGDIARYLSDGVLEFLGRVDNQVKIRGYRIELEEIETILCTHTSVLAAAVSLSTNAQGDKRIISYIVPVRGQAISPQDLRTHLRTKLPDYMLPAVFMPIEKLPLTLSKKVNRKALPPLDASLLELPLTLAAPRNPTEEILVSMWTGILDTSLIGIQDNFFDLGGHSLLAIKLVSRIREAFQIDFSLRTFFEAPTIASLAEYIASARHLQFGLEFPRLQSVPRTEAVPASFAQQSLWFLDQLEPQNSSYNIAAAFRIVGYLDIQALKQSLYEVICRHEALRTTFNAVGGLPMQIVHPPEQCSVDISLIEFPPLPLSQRDEELQFQMSTEASRPFVLSAGPLLRIKLLKMDEKEYVALFTMHHIISDGWSIDVLMHELSVLYAAYTEGSSSPLSALPVQYIDYTAWQYQWLQGELLTEQISYWKQQLADAPDRIESLTDHAQSNKAHTPGAFHTFIISQALTEQLRQLGRKEGATLFIVLLSVWLTLLHHYTQQEDLVIGTPIAGRNHPAVEGLIGLFVNMLALRVDVSGNPSFRELIKRVRKITLDAYAHQDLPFDRVVAEMHPDRKQYYNPLFQIVFALQSKAAVSLKLRDVQFTPLQMKSGTVTFDLALDLAENSDGLHGVFSYSTDLFDEITIEAMGVYYCSLLASIVAHPEHTLDALPLSIVEKNTQLNANLDSEAQMKQETFCSVSELFVKQTQYTPHAIAVILGDVQLSYQELHKRSNRLANYLRRQGVGLEICVGICCERSIELIVGIWGILKAGGVYVPIDPEIPHERLQFILTNTRARLILTQQHIAEKRLPQDVRQLYLDTDWPYIEQESADFPYQAIYQDSLAYIIFTSGSTGEPKGVQVCHHGLTNLAREQIRIFGVGPQSRVIQFASIGFDVSISDLMTTLLAGGTLSLGLPHKARAGADLVEMLRMQAITTVELTPSVLATLPIGDIPTLQEIVIGGETVSSELLAKWQITGRNIYNAYGPTEATIGTTIGNIRQEGGRVSLGSAIAHTQIYILDPRLRPVPPGATGEIFIGGIGVARGYLNDPALTAERFIPNPFSSIPNARFYRTGDLARYLPNGKSVFLRRTDGQVKFRGYRIEPGEIESILVAHPFIQQAAVILRKDAQGNQRLMAYLLLCQTPFNEDTIRAYSKERLPAYMVPTAFVLVDAFPLTSNGKVNYRALPEPEKGTNYPENERYVAPCSQIEEQLALIWQEVLGIKRVGVYDDFFELGGHSLLATQVVSRLQETFQREVSLSTFMQHPTIADWVQIFEENNWSVPAKLSERLISPALRDRELPLSYAQQRLWITYELQPDDISYNVFAAFRLQGHLNISILNLSFDEIVRRHEILRTTFEMGKKFPVQIITPHAPINLPLIDLSGLEVAQREVELMGIATQEATTPFNLRRGPLLRLLLICLAPQQHATLLSMHHIIIDGWSIELIAREISHLYTAYTQGFPSPLPEPSIQYADYAVWQRTWLESKRIEKQLDFWRLQLAGFPVQGGLPTDYLRTEKRSSQGAIYDTLLTEDLATQLKSLSQQEDGTLFMTILAAWSALLYQQINQQDIIVGASIAGRNYSEVEELVGFFVNTLPLRTRFTGHFSFRQILRHAKQVAWEAFENQDVPFDLIVSELHPERTSGTTPFFQVLLTFHNTKPVELKLAQISLEQINIELETAKYDIVLIVDDQKSNLRISWNYNTSLFEEATIRRWASLFERLLKQVIQSPDTPLDLLKAGDGRDDSRNFGRNRRQRATDRVLRTVRPQVIRVEEDEI